MNGDGKSNELPVILLPFGLEVEMNKVAAQYNGCRDPTTRRKYLGIYENLKSANEFD